MLEVKTGKRPKPAITKAQQASMISDCCEAGCKTGVRHEYGEQYCKKCGDPCRWKTGISNMRGPSMA